MTLHTISPSLGYEYTLSDKPSAFSSTIASFYRTGEFAYVFGRNYDRLSECI